MNQNYAQPYNTNIGVPANSVAGNFGDAAGRLQASSREDFIDWLALPTDYVPASGGTFTGEVGASSFQAGASTTQAGGHFSALGLNDSRVGGHLHSQFGVWVRNGGSPTRLSGMDASTPYGPLNFSANGSVGLSLDSNGKVYLPAVASAPNADTYKMQAEALHGRRFGLYVAANGAEGGIMADSQLQHKANSHAYRYHSGSNNQVLSDVGITQNGGSAFVLGHSTVVAIRNNINTADSALTAGDAAFSGDVTLGGKLMLNAFDSFSSPNAGSVTWESPFGGTATYKADQSGQQMKFILKTSEDKQAGFTHYDAANAKGRLLDVWSQPGVDLSFSPGQIEAMRFDATTGVASFTNSPTCAPTDRGEQFGAGATAGIRSVAFGDTADSSIGYGTAIGFRATALGSYGVAIGNESEAGQYGVAVGPFAEANFGVSVGRNCTSGTYGVCLGYVSSVANYGVGIGANSATDYGCINIGWDTANDAAQQMMLGSSVRPITNVKFGGDHKVTWSNPTAFASTIESAGTNIATRFLPSSRPQVSASSGTLLQDLLTALDLSGIIEKVA